MKTSASFKENIAFSSAVMARLIDVKIQRSRIDYAFKFQTRKGGKYILNSWIGLKKSETKSFMIMVVNSE